MVLRPLFTSIFCLTLMIGAAARAQAPDADAGPIAPAPAAVEAETLDEPVVEAPVVETPAVIEETAPAPAPQAEAEAEPAALPAPAATRDVNYATLESSGTISNVREGALGKGLWQDHNRSNIVLMLGRIPLRTEMRSVTLLKKGALLTQADASTIKNDIEPKAGYDLLTLRLYALLDSGMYRDAYDLYTQSVEDPYTEELARVGILLILYNHALATACLEEKVLAPRYVGSDFWEMMDAACNIEMGGTTNSTALSKSAVINAIFSQPDYKVPAADHAALMGMSRFERAMVLAQGRLDYTAMVKDPSLGLKADPALLMLYLNDKTLPESLALPFMKEAISRGLLSALVLKKADPEYKRITTLESEGDKAAALESLLSTEKNPAVLIPYADMIRENSALALSPAQARKALSVLVLAGGDIPSRFTDSLMAEAAAQPQNYVYLQVLAALGRTDKSVNIPVDKLMTGVNALGIAKSGQLLAIIENLDNGKKLNDNPARVYEKQLGLTSAGYYVMPSVGLTEWLKTAADKKLTGLTVLITLSMLPDQPGTIYAGTLGETITALQAVGLIESANKIIEDILVSAVNDNK